MNDDGQNSAEEELHQAAMDDTALETRTDLTPTRKSGPANQLHANYESIIKARSIYFPVAYKFLKELGRGRQGVVFLGIRQGARGCTTRHAIKLYDPSIYSSPDKYYSDMGRIAAQTSKLQPVHNPNLVVRDTYEEYNGIGYIQMEAIDGIDLHYLLHGNHLEQARKNASDDEWQRINDVMLRIDQDRFRIQPGITLHLMRQVLRGLEVLHKNGFVHCDLKPANIMINRTGYAQLVDLGRAVEINEKVSMILGTPLYMAPEIHRREPSMAASDLYSVGLVGLELLRGEPITKPGHTSENDLIALKQRIPDMLLDLLPDYVRQSQLFVKVLRRLLDPDPHKRYATAEAAEKELRDLHNQLVKIGKDTQYSRELGLYLNKLENPNTGYVKTPGKSTFIDADVSF